MQLLHRNIEQLRQKEWIVQWMMQWLCAVVKCSGNSEWDICNGSCAVDCEVVKCSGNIERDSCSWLCSWSCAVVKCSGNVEWIMQWSSIWNGVCVLQFRLLLRVCDGLNWASCFSTYCSTFRELSSDTGCRWKPLHTTGDTPCVCVVRIKNIVFGHSGHFKVVLYSDEMPPPPH